MTEALTHQTKPLPGLAKLYLLQLYPMALVMLCARFVFSFMGIGKSDTHIEPLIWSIIFVCFGAASVCIIAGIHARAGWALKYTARFNLALCALLAAGFVRILTQVSAADIFRYSFDDGKLFMLMAPAALAMYIPMFFAWRLYFSASPRLYDAFGLAPQRDGILPPAGVGILQALSTSFLLFYLAFFLGMAVAGGAKAFSEGRYILLVLGLPPVFIFAALFVLSRSPGKKQGPLLASLAFTAVFMLIWAYAPSYIITLMRQNALINLLYDAMRIFSMLPMNANVMSFLAALLAWKIWADQKEQTWFADGQNAERIPAAFSLYNIVLLYYAFNPLLSGGILLASMLGDDDREGQWQRYFAATLAVPLVLLQLAALYNRAAKRWKEKTLSLVSFAASAAFNFFIIGLLFVEIFSDEEFRPALNSLLYTLSFYLAPLAGALVALLHWRAVYTPAQTGAEPWADAPQARGLFSLKGPKLAFALFCILLMTGALSKKTAELCAQIFLSDNYYVYAMSVGGNMTSQILNLEFWAAYLVCPLLALKWLCAGLARLKNFYVLGVIWVYAILASSINELLATLNSQGLFAFSFSMRTLLSPTKQIYICAIILFMVYLSSARGKTPDAPDNRSEDLSTAAN